MFILMDNAIGGPHQQAGVPVGPSAPDSRPNLNKSSGGKSALAPNASENGMTTSTSS